MIDLLKWTIYHPVDSILILMLAYAILFTLYNQKKFSIVAKACAPFFLAYDVLVNVTAMTILMLDFPQPPDWTVTARLRRYKLEYPHDRGLNSIQKYRLWIAEHLCRLANKFDEGHC
jgi:hypothetical protein